MLLKKRYKNKTLNRLCKPISLIILTIIIVLITTNCLGSSAGNLSTPYTQPSQFTSLPFGTHSHWLQPWRAYSETIPAKKFLDGIGIVFKPKQNPELIAQMLAKQGIRQARFEISWGSLDYDDEAKLRKEAQFRERLLAFKKFGIRPLILLNGNHGRPCPMKTSQRTIIKDAYAGDNEIQLQDVSDLQVDYSGLSQLTNKGWAAEYLITNISGNTATLSKPLPEDLKAETSVVIDTLKYRPFSVPDSDDYQETIAGWKRYVGSVATFVTETLGTQMSSDKGFDLEIWNELTFGSNFLYINEYYADQPYVYREKSIWDNLVIETASYVDNHSLDFQGVQITNGFSSTSPWPASSALPPRIRALSRHPYPKQADFPQDERKSQPVNALGRKEDKSAFVPTYSVYFPEYIATALQTETLVRNMAPITSKIYGSEKYGRYARKINDEVIPTPVWITEVNTSPINYDPQISNERALAIKAKTTARYLCFFLNKGVERVYLYRAAEQNKNWSIVSENFLDYAKKNTNYPVDDRRYTSPSLRTLGRIVDKMSDRVDPDIIHTRQLEVVSISDTHDRYQFKGDGTKAHPNLYDRDVFTFLPFQVNAAKFVIPYYVMTRNVMTDLEPEKFTITIKGIKGKKARVSTYDPINDKVIPSKIVRRKANSIELELIAADYPNLLNIEE